MLLAAFLRCSVWQRHHHQQQQQQQPTKLAYSGSPLYAYFDIQSLRKLAVCDINVDAYLNLVPVGISFLTVHSLPYIFFFYMQQPQCVVDQPGLWWALGIRATAC